MFRKRSAPKRKVLANVFMPALSIPSSVSFPREETSKPTRGVGWYHLQVSSGHSIYLPT